MRGATEDQRDQLRAQLKENRDAFLTQQRDAREDFRKQLAELKDKLHDHQDVVDEAKAEAKDNAKKRKDGGS